MPGGRVGRDDRTAGRIDLSHHLVAGRRTARRARAMTCCAIRAGSISMRRSRSSWSQPASDGRAPAVPRRGRRARRFRPGREEPARHEPTRIRSASMGEARSGSGLRARRTSTARCPKCPTRGRCSTRSKHLKPTILTGLPLGNWAAPQKVDWAAEHFPGVPIITCMARDKHKHMHAGRRAGRRPREPSRRL